MSPVGRWIRGGVGVTLRGLRTRLCFRQSAVEGRKRGPFVFERRHRGDVIANHLERLELRPIHEDEPVVERLEHGPCGALVLVLQS